MASPTFDPKHAIVFDLARGATQDASKGRLLLVPASAVNELVRGSPDKAKKLGLQIGKTCGTRVALRLGGGEAVHKATIEAVVTEIAGELSIGGVGVISLERWGKALVVGIDNSSVDDDAMLAGIIEGALSNAVGKQVSCVTLSRTNGTARVLVSSDATSKKVQAMLTSGTSWGEILARLSGGAA
jgi:hypothetical protein